MVNQGDIYWVDFEPPQGSAPGYVRPAVVIQNDVYNHSRLRTLVVCALTTNLRLANLPGNVLLSAREANLSRQSVVNVTQMATVDRNQLLEYIGTLSQRRVREISRGIWQVIAPSDSQEAE